MQRTPHNNADRHRADCCSFTAAALDASPVTCSTHAVTARAAHVVGNDSYKERSTIPGSLG
eukprot:1743863-Alexandrium_andersonii.AAC.1